MFESLRSAAYPAADEEASGDRPSEIARGTALVRALAALDERGEIRGRDTLAEIFLADNRKDSLKETPIREWLIKNYLPYGIYAYSMAATAYFDNVVEQALRDNLPQIVFLGAGYDSRPYRLNNLIRDTRIFEVDDAPTQQRKRELLEKANVPVPENLKYVPASSTSDTLKDILFAAGYDEGKQTLFVCEGITYYLSAAEMDAIFNFIKSHSPAGSTVSFDYHRLASGSSHADSMTDLKEALEGLDAVKKSGFGIEEGKIGVFLAERELMSLEHLTAEELEKRYLTLQDGSSVGKVPARYCIVYAALSG